MAKKKTNPEPAADSQPTFEQSLQQLQAIVHDLEDGGLSLSDSLEKYELGVRSLKKCYQSLESAQRKIELLVELDDDGNLITEPFDDTATTETTRATTRQSGQTKRPPTSGKTSGKASGKTINEPVDDDDIDEADGLF